MEKKKRKEREAAKEGRHTKKAKRQHTESESDSDDEVANFNLSNFSNLGSSILGYNDISDKDKLGENKDDMDSGWLNKDIMEGTKSWKENKKAMVNEAITSTIDYRQHPSSHNKLASSLTNSLKVENRDKSKTAAGKQTVIDKDKLENSAVSPLRNKSSFSSFTNKEKRNTISLARKSNSVLCDNIKVEQSSNVLQNNSSCTSIPTSVSSGSTLITAADIKAERIDIKNEPIDVNSDPTETEVPPLHNSIAGSTSELIAANPGKIITLSTSALSPRTKQLLSLKPTTLSGGQKVAPTARLVTLSGGGNVLNQKISMASTNNIVTNSPHIPILNNQGTSSSSSGSQSPILLNPNQILLSHHTLAPGQRTVASSGSQAAVLIPAQSFVLQPTAVGAVNCNGNTAGAVNKQ